MVVVKFERYGALREVSKICVRDKGYGGWRTIVVSRTTLVAIVVQRSQCRLLVNDKDGLVVGK